MAKKRVHEIAKERGISSKEVIAVLQKAGLDVKAAAQSIADWVSGEGWTTLGLIPSPIAGGDGNTELLLGARKP